MSARHEEIFDDARRLPEAERGAYLAETCDSDEQRMQVHSLLERSARANAFFDGLEDPTHVREASIVEEIGDMIGPYTLVQELGEGGFGIVFAAEQTEPIARRVALKIIKQGMDTRQVIRRFEAERQALAIMNHPNISRVLDAGATETGRPYFAMELVEGEPIIDFCERSDLGIRQRLDLFLEVCAAVSHAHQKGIIHRDLKPSNILVAQDEGGQPAIKVIDFGIAKALEQSHGDNSLVTRAEQFVGTPLYVSPEQASSSGDADTRSDVYSLGVILYELLADSTPFDSEELSNKSHDEICRTIREEDPPKPSTRLASVPGDLDWIVLKALEKDREHRYESANAFAQDIRNYLDDQPVSAAAPSVAYRLRKLVKRHQTAFGAGAAVLFALIVGLGVSITALVREAEAREEESVQRHRAEAWKRSAQQISSLLQDVLGSIDPAVAQGRDTSLLQTVVDKLAARIDSEIPSDTAEGAELRFTLGKVYAALGDGEPARKWLTAALEGARSSGDDELTVDLLLQLARIESDQFGGSLEHMRELLEEATPLSVKVNGRDHPKTLVAKSRLGTAIGGTRGKELIQEAMDLADRTLARDVPARTIISGNFTQMMGARVSLREHVALWREHSENERLSFGSEHPRFALARALLSHQLCRLAEIEDLRDLSQEALKVASETDQLMRKLYQSGDERRTRMAWTLAQAHVASGDIESAGTEWRRALEEQSGTGKDESVFGRYARAEIAWMLLRRGHEDEGRRLAMLSAEDNRLPTWQRRFWVSLAFAHHEWEMAESELLQLVPDGAQVARDGSVVDWMKLAALYLHVGNTDAYNNLRGRMLERFGTSDSARVYFVAPVSADIPSTATALKVARRALKNAKKPGFQKRLTLGMAEFRSGNFKEAEILLRSASNETATRWGPSQIILASFLSMNAAEMGQNDEARRYLQQAEERIGSIHHETLSLNGHGHGAIFAQIALEEARDFLAGATGSP